MENGWYLMIHVFQKWCKMDLNKFGMEMTAKWDKAILVQTHMFYSMRNKKINQYQNKIMKVQKYQIKY